MSFPQIPHKLGLSSEASLEGLNSASDVNIALNQGANLLARMLHSGVVSSPKHASNLGK